MEILNGYSVDSSVEGIFFKSGEFGYFECFWWKGILLIGCCYDDCMKFYVNVDFGLNFYYLEDLLCIEVIMRIFKKYGFLFMGIDVEFIDVINNRLISYMWRIFVREVIEEEICIVYRVEYFNWVKVLFIKIMYEFCDILVMMD